MISNYFVIFFKALLSKTLCQSLYESKTGPLKTGIGFGFGAIQMNDDVVFYHDGDMPSSSTRMMFYPETKVDQSVFIYLYFCFLKNNLPNYKSELGL